MDIRTYIIAPLMVIFGLAIIVWFFYGLAFRFLVSRKEGIGFLEVSMPRSYNIAMWVIAIPLVVLQFIFWITG